MKSSSRARRSPFRTRIFVEPLEDRLAPATFTVINADDSGTGSLRAAITAANTAPGADRIEFAIGTGHQTIDLLSALPAISSPVAIAGQTQPGFVDSPLIELNGAGAGTDTDGIFVRAGGSGSVIRSLVINRFDDIGIRLLRTSCVVRGCFIGTDAAGTAAQGNGLGIEIDGTNFVTGAASVIGGPAAGWRNVISGNLGTGVAVDGQDAKQIVIQGNFIGTDVNGAAAIGNGGDGVSLSNGANANLIGGTTAGSGNVISGNAGHGVMMEGLEVPRAVILTHDNTVQGNLIGTDINGTAALPNGGGGVALLDLTSANRIGGTAAGARNIISGNSGAGVRLSGASIANKIKGNFIGTDAAGAVGLGNTGDGIVIENSASGNVIGGPVVEARNIISGNGDDGVALVTATANTILGNFIGTDAAGTGLVGNTGDGVSINDSANANLIGGTTPGARNVISANQNGIVISGSSSNQVQGNQIGTDRTGAIDLGNLGSGVVIEEPATRNVIGGTAVEARNIISGNGAFGVLLEGTDTALNRVRGNFIGTDRAGTAKLGNAFSGVALRGGTHDNSIGGDVAGAGNVISGNDASGVLLEEAGTEESLVQGNFIGTDGTATLDLGNGTHGVFITDNASGNSIGGTTVGAGNIIAFNGDDGVLVGSDPGRGFSNPAGTRNPINQNRIFSNGGQGIDLGPNDGVTANDDGDPDIGPNLLQNYPVLFNAQLFPTSLEVEGTLKTQPNRTYRIEFFATPTADPSSNGEGKRYLGFVMVTTDPEGNAAFAVFLPVVVSAGHVITATATYEFGNTSEFSTALLVT